MNIYTPFTYLIGWSNHNKFYYGVRFAQNCNPSDLWNIYFTSSKYVHQMREEYGDPDIIQIRKTFSDRQSAMVWEKKVLSRLKVIGNDKWLNMSVAGSIDPDSFREIARQRMLNDNPMKNPDITKKVGKKLSTIVKNRMDDMTPEERSIRYGNHGSDNPFYGKSHSKETLKQIADKNSKSYILHTPSDEKLCIRNLYQYCKENDLNRDALMKSLRTGRLVPPVEDRYKKISSKSRYNTIGYKLEHNIACS